MAQVKNLEQINTNQDRLMFRWNRPAESAPGWTVSLSIVVPSLKPSLQFKKIAIDKKRVRWFSPLSEGEKYTFTILFSKKGYDEDDAKTTLRPGDQIVGSVRKDNGEMAWMMMRIGKLSPAELLRAHNILDGVVMQLKPETKPDSVRSTRALFLTEPDPMDTLAQPTLMDIELGKTNLALGSKGLLE